MMNCKLSNGIGIPSIGIGTFMLSPDEAENAVCQALAAGYRMVDTANGYVNERAVEGHKKIKCKKGGNFSQYKTVAYRL